MLDIWLHMLTQIACPCSNATTSSSDVQTEAIANVNGTSLIPDTLEEMATDTDFQQTAERLRRLGQAAMTREEKQKRQRSLDKIGVPSFSSMVQVGWRKPINSKNLISPASCNPRSLFSGTGTRRFGDETTRGCHTAAQHWTIL